MTKWIERAVNEWLATDPETARQLVEFEGAVIEVEITTLPLTLRFAPEEGRVRVLDDTEGRPRVRICGGAFELLRFALGKSTRLTIEGDVSTAHALQRLIRSGDFDWEELLAQRVGDVAAHEMARVACFVGRNATRSFDRVADAVGEYLREEAQLVPDEREIRGFIENVDALRDRVERLAAQARW